MKKVWQVIFVLCMLSTSAIAGVNNHLLADAWIDSIYQKLTVAERIGQLIDLRIKPEEETVDQLFEVITKNNIGSVTIIGGDVNASVRLINALNASLKVPVFVSAETNNSINLPFSSAAHFPAPTTYNQSDDPILLNSSIEVLSNIYQELGIYGSQYSPISLRFSENELRFYNDFENSECNLFKNVKAQYHQNGIVLNTDFYFEFSDDFAFSPKSLDTWNSGDWREKTNLIKDEWNKNNYSQSIITIKSLPEFPENEASFFSKKIINPLLWKQLQFGGILSADVDAIKEQYLTNGNDETIRSLLKIGSDKIVISDNVDEAFLALMDGLDDRYFRQNEIRGKVKRMLTFKYHAGLSDAKPINDSHLNSKINDPEIQKLSYQVYTKATQIENSASGAIPFQDLKSKNFASLVLGFNELKTFQETLGKYAPFVHYMLPDIAFDPYDLNILSEQLVQFDHVIVGLHSDGLLELDHSVIDFLNMLNNHTEVVLVFLGKAANGLELNEIENKIFVHEDNMFTQQIAAQTIFGALDKDNGLNRLAYSTPEMQRMDSKSLQKIDKIVEEAISISATPGCQVLVARNGSVILEKGYGYYTYDSIMPVDTRTIYDLASITKVAATTQAIMKLTEEGKINLDSTLGAYLPELEGSNKASLVINDILAHQSGLKAFYPFWRNTIEDDDKIIHYYKDNPSIDYKNTVAYGMFAAEDLKDSLWHWTVDTKLRRKKDKYQPYDYKYSDLGFYLLQVLVERVSEKPLDTFLDSVFYQSMGMSTLGFNPLCKYPLKRITPTERDTKFRHVLVWGTVHDEIAAMKGGISGHAGLFSNAHDVAKIMQMQLQEGEYGGNRYLEEETINSFNSQQHKDSRRGLGWDKPEKGDGYNPASRYASFDAFGHSGFTGTVVWADPTFDLIFVFLSNRIYPKSSNGKLIDFNIRKRIHDVVYESIWNYGKSYN